MAWYNPFSWGSEMQDNVFDKDKGLLQQAGSWIGNQNFTEEDRAEYNAEIAKGVIAYSIKTMDENTDRSKARRSIAIMWIKVHLFLVLLTALFIPIDKEISGRFFDLAVSQPMTYGTAGIMIFFFGSYGVARFNETKKDK